MVDKYNVSKNSFSLIIPFENDCKYIEQCIKSVLFQKFVKFEAIFINVNSSDDSDKIVAKYAKANPNIRLMNNPTVTNINKAYNFGISLSEGKYIKFMSARSVLDTKALPVLSKMMDNEKTDLSFHIKSKLVNNNFIIPQCYNWVKGSISPVYAFSLLNKTTEIYDLQNHIAFNKAVFVKNNLFFDETMDMFDVSKIIKLFCVNKNVSIVYHDMVKELAPDRIIISDTKKNIENIDKMNDYISKAVNKCYFQDACKNEIDEFYINYLSRIFKFSEGNKSKKFANKASSVIKKFNFTYKPSRAIYNYKNISDNVSYIKLSIIYTFSEITPTLENYINNFINKSNLYEELVLVNTNKKYDVDMNLLCQSCNRIKYVKTNSIYSVITDNVEGEYFIFQNDDNICIDDLFDEVSYASKINSDMLFAPIDCHTLSNILKYNEYLKYDNKLFGYENIYANKILNLIYRDSEIIYKTEYITDLFKNHKFIDENYLAVISLLGTKQLSLYSRFVSAYKGDVKIDCEKIYRMFYQITSVDLNKLSEYEELLYKFDVQDIISFYKKLYSLNQKYSEKLETTSVSINKKEQYALTRMDVLNSNLWDERYYLKQFDYSKSKIKLSPLDHYLLEGWKKGYSPSKYFDGPAYARQHSLVQDNPLAFYLDKGRFQYKTYPVNPYEASEESIAEYWKNKKKNKKVIYMCITGNYDNLDEIKAHTYINPEWDYVCFTDNKDYLKAKTVGIWKIKPLRFKKLDNTRNNRWHKVHPHILFPKYEESIYLDSNINILTPFLFNEIKERNVDLLLPKHAGNFSIYYEYVWAMKAKVDKLDVIMRECEEIFKQGFPFYYGMPECNIIYRRHSSKTVTELMDDWWYWIKTYAKRDQLSFSYLLWKHRIKISDCTFVNARIAYKDFCVFLHPMDRKQETVRSIKQ